MPAEIPERGEDVKISEKYEAAAAELIRYCATSLRAWMILEPRSAEEVALDLERKWAEICQR